MNLHNCYLFILVGIGMVAVRSALLQCLISYNAHLCVIFIFFRISVLIKQQKSNHLIQVQLHFFSNSFILIAIVSQNNEYVSYGCLLY